MTAGRARRLLAAMWVAFAVAFAYVASGGWTVDLLVVGQGTFLVLGTVILLRRPSHRIGWILAVSGVGWTIAVATDIGAERLMERDSVTAAGWVAMVGTALHGPLLWAFNVAALLVFPDGRAVTRSGARLLRWSGWLAAILVVVAVVTEPTPIPPTEVSYPHPFLDDPLPLHSLYLPIAVAFFALGFVAAGMLVARGRHAAAIERRQIVVVASGYAVALTLWLATGIAGSYEDRSFLLLDIVANAVLAGSIAVAVIRYRLFELGRFVRRSIVYAGLAAVIAVVYVSVVVLIGAYYGDEADVPLSIAATVAVALVFQPARRSLERIAGRLVYGPRADPQEVLARFARRAAELPDDELLARIPELVAQGTAARSAAVWVRADGGFHTQAAWPADVPARTMPAADDFDVPGADRSLPVFDGGELLGGVSIEKEPGEEVTPADDALLVDLAAALGVAMRNVQLASDLRRQLDALLESRRRLVTAGEDARRELEWRLDSGPQQNLVALKVKLGPVRARAERMGAVEVAELLGRLETETEDAITSIRRFAAGVPPPELAAEGLAAAIRSLADRTAFRLEVHDRRPAPIDRATEVAVYFTVLEALQNAAKHAGASSVVVTLGSTGGGVSFEVVDDGRGFDAAGVGAGDGLRGMRERIDAVGGRLEVRTSPGAGTRIIGHVPGVHSPERARAHVSSRTSMENADLAMNAAAPAAVAGPSKSPDS